MDRTRLIFLALTKEDDGVKFFFMETNKLFLNQATKSFFLLTTKLAFKNTQK